MINTVFVVSSSTVCRSDRSPIISFLFSPFMPGFVNQG